MVVLTVSVYSQKAGTLDTTYRRTGFEAGTWLTPHAQFTGEVWNDVLALPNNGFAAIGGSSINSSNTVGIFARFDSNGTRYFNQEAVCQSAGDPPCGYNAAGFFPNSNIIMAGTNIRTEIVFNGLNPGSWSTFPAFVSPPPEYRDNNYFGVTDSVGQVPVAIKAINESTFVVLARSSTATPLFRLMSFNANAASYVQGIRVNPCPDPPNPPVPSCDPPRFRYFVAPQHNVSDLTIAAADMAIQPDGKIVAVGTLLDIDGRKKIVVRRYISDLAFDTSFGTDGQTVTDFGVGADTVVKKISIQSDGKILVAGDRNDASGYPQFAVVRYNSDGSVDSSFGVDGMATGFTWTGAAPTATMRNRVSGLVVQADGKIVVSGRHGSGGFGAFDAGAFQIVRLNSDGSIDPNYGAGNNGVFQFQPVYSLQNHPWALTLDSSGRAVMVGQCGLTPIAVTCTARVLAKDSSALRFSAASYSVNEGAGTATITVRRVTPSSVDGDVSINYATSDGTAIGDTDYTPVSGTLTWGDGDYADKTFTVPIIKDTFDEPNETINLTLSDISGSGIYGTPNTATLTIVDNDLPTALKFDAAAYSVAEDGGSVTITVNRADNANFEVSVDYATSSRTAGNADYTPVSGTLTWADGDTKPKQFVVPILEDFIFEGNEQFAVTLSNPTNGAILGTPSTANITIIDNDPAECTNVATNAISWWKGEDNANDQILQNAGTLVGGTAFADGKVGRAFNFDGVSDYVSVPNDPSLNPTGSFTLEAWVNPSDNRTWVALLTKGQEQAGSLQYKIDMNNLRPRFVVSPNGGNVSVAASSQAIPLNTWTHIAGVFDGLSNQVRLYVNGTLIISASINYSIVANKTDELRIGAYYGASYFKGMIDEPAIYGKALTDNEILKLYSSQSLGKCSVPPNAGKLRFVNTAYTVNENDGIATVTVNRIAGSTGEASVHYATSNGTASANDYTSVSGTLTWADGDLAPKQFIVPIAEDSVFEANETILLTLSDPSAGVELAAPSTATLTIVDNDTTGCVQPPVDQISWWKAEDNANDQLKINNGTLIGGTAFVDGKVGRAFNFDGIDDYVSVPNAPSLNPTGSFTLEAWVNPTDNREWHTIMSKWDHTVGKGQYLFDMRNRRPRFVVSPNGSNFNETLSGQAIPLDTWSHVAAVFDGENRQIRVYINGVLSASAFVTYSAVANKDLELKIGVAYNDNRSPFKGMIDEPTIYNRALTDSEISAIFTAQSEGKCSLNASQSNVSISGRVAMPNGRGISRALVTLTAEKGESRVVVTNTFGRFSFPDTLTGRTYTLTVTDRRHDFGKPRVISLTGAIDDLVIQGIPR